MIWLQNLVLCWLGLATFGQVALYVGFGFAMNAKHAAALRGADGVPIQQRRVYLLDAWLALVVILLDALSNLLVYSVICLDFRLKTLVKPVWRIAERRICGVTIPAFNVWCLQLVTGRLSNYLADPHERAFRKTVAEFMGALLNAKDFNHIKGASRRFPWLD